ncbi:MAG: phosphate ABC transporter permease PstA [Gemmatimonadota bacterium]|nr:phosphate ABC transporter permease PstA [Gemmatimonadota bacterium]
MTRPTSRRDPIGAACRVAALVVLFGFLAFAAYLGFTASQVVGMDFLRGASSGAADSAGIGPALAGTLWLLLLTAVLALPIGIGTAIYLEEYAPRTRLTAVIESVAANLAGIPSVIYGIVGLALFVRALGMGPTILAGGCTLAVLALPVVIVTSRTAIRRVPAGLRLAAYGLGATRWQVVRNQILPVAGPGILAGCCAAFTRTAGAAAPLLVLGTATFMSFAPQTPAHPLTSLPTQIFSWATRSHEGFTALAAGAAIVLLLLLLVMNLVSAFVVRRLGGASP